MQSIIIGNCAGETPSSMYSIHLLL